MNVRSERQYSSTLEWIERFEDSINKLKTESDSGAHIDPFLRSILIKAQESQLESLKEDAAEYVALKSGTLRHQRVESFGELPGALISGRIAAGLTQKQLAQRLGLKEQQIQRYEATGYRSASIDRVSEVAFALGLKIRADVRLPRPGGR